MPPEARERDWALVTVVAVTGLVLGFFLALIWAILAAAALAIALRQWAGDRNRLLVVLCVGFALGGLASIVIGSAVSSTEEGGPVEVVPR